MYWTACDALFTRCGLSAGDRLLVTVAAGGVGVAGVQLGALAGATVIGVGSGARIELELLTLMRKRATIGSTLRVRNRAEKAAVADAVRAHVLPLLADRRVRVPVCATFPLADVTGAYDRFTEGKKLGKVVLVTGDG